MKPSKQIIIDFIVEQLQQGSERGEVLAKCGEKWQTPPRTFDRYFKEAKEQHVAAQQVVKKELAKVSIEQAKESLKKQILTADERKEFLSKLVLKETKLLKVGAQVQMVHSFIDKDGNIVNEILPTELKIKAIAELNKMEGDYAATKQDVTIHSPMIIDWNGENSTDTKTT